MRKKDAKPSSTPLEIRVRRMHRRDLNKTWEFVKLVFRDVNRETVEYQRPRSKRRFAEVYEQEDVEQLLFETEEGEVVGYAECAFDSSGSDNWINPRYFEKRGMRPMFVEELAVHPGYQGRGVGSFVIDQLQHLARLRGCTHLVLEVAENNETALSWYRRRNFFKLDAAIFLAQKLNAEPELLPPRTIPARRVDEGKGANGKSLSLPARTAARARAGAKSRTKKAPAKRAPKLVVAAEPEKAPSPRQKAPARRPRTAAPALPNPPMLVAVEPVATEAEAEATAREAAPPRRRVVEG